MTRFNETIRYHPSILRKKISYLAKGGVDINDKHEIIPGLARQ